jgi:hypothetical protein
MGPILMSLCAMHETDASRDPERAVLSYSWDLGPYLGPAREVGRVGRW